MIQTNVLSAPPHVLLSAKEFKVNYSRNFNHNYQSWSFSHSETVSFLPDQTLEQRLELVARASALCKYFVRQDMWNTIPDIVAEFPEMEGQLRQVWAP